MLLLLLHASTAVHQRSATATGTATARPAAFAYFCPAGSQAVAGTANTTPRRARRTSTNRRCTLDCYILLYNLASLMECGATHRCTACTQLVRLHSQALQLPIYLPVYSAGPTFMPLRASHTDDTSTSYVCTCGIPGVLHPPLPARCAAAELEERLTIELTTRACLLLDYY